MSESYGADEIYSTDSLYSVLVEITTYCNMRCSACIRTVHNVQSKWVNEHISLADFQRVIESLPPADEIVTQGVGEPTMHPNLPEIIRIARESDKFGRVSFTTNAMLRDQDYYSQLFSEGLTRLYISVDSFDPVLAEHLRAGTRVDRLKEMVASLSAAFPGKIGIRTVVGSENVEAVPAMLEEMNRLGKLSVFLHPYDDMGNDEGCIPKEGLAKFGEQMRLISESFPNLRITANHFIPSPEICIHPWRIPAVTVDGFLTPCCRMTDKNVFTFGNMLSSSFREVWDSAQSAEMREQFLERSAAFCQGCPRHVIRGDTSKMLPVISSL